MVRSRLKTGAVSFQELSQEFMCSVHLDIKGMLLSVICFAAVRGTIRIFLALKGLFRLDWRFLLEFF